MLYLAHEVGTNSWIDEIFFSGGSRGCSDLQLEESVYKKLHQFKPDLARRHFCVTLACGLIERQCARR